MSRQTEGIEFTQPKWLMELGDLWCHFMHASPRWPIHGQYECGVCGRRFLVPWEAVGTVQAHASPLGFGPALATIRK
jgi:hypothetical protein